MQSRVLVVRGINRRPGGVDVEMSPDLRWWRVQARAGADVITETGEQQVILGHIKI